MCSLLTTISLSLQLLMFNSSSDWPHTTPAAQIGHTTTAFKLIMQPLIPLDSWQMTAAGDNSDTITSSLIPNPSSWLSTIDTELQADKLFWISLSWPISMQYQETKLSSLLQPTTYSIKCSLMMSKATPRWPTTIDI